jgi:hypothetical protein
MKIKSVKKDKDFMTNNFNNVYVLTLEKFGMFQKMKQTQTIKQSLHG